MSGLKLFTSVRLPIRAGARLTTASMTPADRPFADPDSNDYFRVLIDNLNQDLLAEVAKDVSGEAYLLAFVRGSSVKDRLELTQTYWPRIVDCFALEEVRVDLERTYGIAAVAELFLKIKKRIYTRLLRAQRGPSKLLFRIKNPASEVLERSNYEAIAAFVNEVPKFAKDLDETVKQLFVDAGLGDAERSVKEQLSLLLHRFELNASCSQIATNFDRFVEIQKEANCLHPALPMAAKAVWRVADMLRTTPDVARQLMTLFRIAWLCRVEDPNDSSDFALKSLVVIPQPETALGGIDNGAEATLATTFDAMERIRQSQADVKLFRVMYPEVRVSISASALSLPKPLFETFGALDSGEDRLDFITRYRTGPAYFQKHFDHLRRDPRYGKKIDALDAKCNRRLGDGVTSLLDRSVYIKTKTGKDGRLKRKTISPLGTNPMQIRELLTLALEHLDGEYVEQCSGLFNKVAKDDLVGRIRGVWTMKGHGVSECTELGPVEMKTPHPWEVNIRTPGPQEGKGMSLDLTPATGTANGEVI